MKYTTKKMNIFERIMQMADECMAGIPNLKRYKDIKQAVRDVVKRINLLEIKLNGNDILNTEVSLGTMLDELSDHHMSTLAADLLALKFE